MDIKLQNVVKSKFQSMARTLTKKWDIQVVVAGTRCCTDGKRIFVPGNSDDMQGDNAKLLEGCFDHELWHNVDTRKHEKAGKPNTFQLMNNECRNSTERMMLNVFDDIRIEREAAEEYIGMAQNLRKLNDHHMNKYSNTPVNQLAAGGFWKLLGCAIIAKAQGYNVEWPQSVMKALERVEDEVIASRSTEWAEDGLVLARRVIEKVKDLKDEMKQEQEQRKEQQKQAQQNQDTQDEQDEDSEQGQAGDSDDTEDEQDSDEEGQSQDSDDEEDNEQPEGQGQADDDNDDTEDDDSDNTEGEDAEGSDSDDNEDDDTEDDDTEDSDNTEGSDNDSDDSQDSDDDTQDEQGEDSDSEGGEAENNDGDTGENADISDEDLDEMVDDLEDSENDADTDDLNDEANDEVEQDAIDDIESNDRYTTHPQALDMDTWVTPDNSDKDTYTKLAKEVKRQVSALKGKLGRILRSKAQSRRVVDQEEGDLDGGSLWRLRTGNPNVFTQTRQGEDTDTCVSMLIDLSGSMGKCHYDESGARFARLTAIAMAETLSSLNIPFEILGFCNRGSRYGLNQGNVRYTRTVPYEFVEFKGYNESHKKVRARMVHMDGRGANADGEAVLMAAKRMATRRESRKILLVLSDGQPTAVNDAALGEKHLKDVVTAIAKAGVEVYGIGMGAAHVAEYYNADTGSDHVIINDLNTMAKEVIRLLKNKLTKKGKKVA